MGGPWSRLDLTGGLVKQSSNNDGTVQLGHSTADDRPSYGGAEFLKTVLWRSIGER